MIYLVQFAPKKGFKPETPAIVGATTSVGEAERFCLYYNEILKGEKYYYFYNPMTDLTETKEWKGMVESES